MTKLIFKNMMILILSTIIIIIVWICLRIISAPTTVTLNVAIPSKQLYTIMEILLKAIVSLKF